MRHIHFLILFLLIFGLIVVRFDAIRINSDDYHVFNFVRDMVEKPSYFSLTGGGYRVLHRLFYLPVFLFYDFDVTKVAFPALLITGLFDLLLVIASYVLFKRMFNWRVATIVVFLLITSHLIIRNTWYWGTTHLHIGTFFLLMSIYFLTKSQKSKDYFLSSVFCFLAILTRETFNVILLGIFVVSLFMQNRYRCVKNYVIFFWPFCIYGIFALLNLHYLGSIVRPGVGASGLISISPNNIVNFYDYFNYLIKSLLILPIGVAIVLFILRCRNYFSAVNELTFDKLILCVWFLSGVFVLLLTSNTDPRYMIPFLPVLFDFMAKVFDSYLFERDDALFFLFEKVLLSNILFWVILFNSSKIAKFMFLSYNSMSVLLNILLYFIVLYAIVSPLLLLKKNSNLIFKTVSVIVFVSFTLTSFVQLGMTYSFFVFQHNYTDAMNEAVAFIAKSAPQDSYVVSNPMNPLTGIDPVWFEAFKRTDLQVIHMDKDISINFTKPAFYVGTPTSQIDTDVITPFVYANKKDFKLIAKFGSEVQKYPSLRISNNFNKAVSQFFATKLLFRLEPLQGYVVFIFERV